MTPLYSKNKDDLQIQESVSRHLPPHLHQEAELILITAGTLELGVETNLYHMECGDLALVFPNQVHHFQIFDPAPSKCKALHLWLAPSYFGSYEETLLEKSPENPVLKKEDIHPDVLYALKNLRADFEVPGSGRLVHPMGPGTFHHRAAGDHQHRTDAGDTSHGVNTGEPQNQTGTSELQRQASIGGSASPRKKHEPQSYYEQVMADPENLHAVKPLIVLSHAWVQIIFSRILPVLHLIQRKDLKDYDLIYQVVSYIAGHFRENVSLTSMASDLGASPYALSRVFSKTFHRNFNQYLNDTRLSYAAVLLSDPDVTITDAYLDSGFQSQATFNRVFQERFHMTPREYRKERVQAMDSGVSQHHSPV